MLRSAIILNREEETGVFGFRWFLPFMLSAVVCFTLPLAVIGRLFSFVCSLFLKAAFQIFLLKSFFFKYFFSLQFLQ